MANKQIKDLTSEKTTPAITDLLGMDDGSTGVTYKVQIQNILKSVNGLTEDTLPDPSSDYILSYDTSASLPKKVKPANLIISYPCNGRLTLTSATPITTSDVTAATNIYFTPFMGDQIALYNGSSWANLTFTETTLALGTLTSGLPYDVFAYNNSGTMALEALAWTNATTRATALTTQNGILVKSGTTTRRYLGTFCTTSTTTTEDSAARRYVWNYYNRVKKFLSAKDTTNSWAYTTAAFREINGGSTYGTSRVGVMVGWSEDIVSVIAHHVATASAGSPATATGIGLDSATNVALANQQIVTSTIGYPTSATWKGFPGVGQHYIAHLEYGAANVTFYGDNGASIFQTGLAAECSC